MRHVLAVIEAEHEYYVAVMAEVNKRYAILIALPSKIAITSAESEGKELIWAYGIAENNNAPAFWLRGRPRHKPMVNDYLYSTLPRSVHSRGRDILKGNSVIVPRQ